MWRNTWKNTQVSTCSWRRAVGEVEEERRKKRKAKIKYDLRLLCCRIWVAVKGVGQRSNLILFRKITVLGVWWIVWRGTG